MTEVEWIEREAKRVFSASVEQGHATAPGVDSPRDEDLGPTLYELTLVGGKAHLLQRGLILRLGPGAVRTKYANIRRLEGLHLQQLMRANGTGIATLVSLTLVLGDGALTLSMQLAVYASLFSFLRPVVAKLGGED